MVDREISVSRWIRWILTPAAWASRTSWSRVSTTRFHSRRAASACSFVAESSPPAMFQTIHVASNALQHPARRCPYHPVHVSYNPCTGWYGLLSECIAIDDSISTSGVTMFNQDQTVNGSGGNGYAGSALTDSEFEILSAAAHYMPVLVRHGLSGVSALAAAFCHHRAVHNHKEKENTMNHPTT